MDNNKFKFPVKVEPLLPHKPPILMVDSILSVDDEKKSSIIETTVKAEFPFLYSDNSLLGEALIEIMAQASAAQHGFNLKRDGEKEEKGFLVGIRKFEIKDKVFLGDRLEVSVTLGPEIESLSVIYGKVLCNDKLIATSELTVWHGSHK